jgi:hypothetical protein
MHKLTQSTLAATVTLAEPLAQLGDLPVLGHLVARQLDAPHALYAPAGQ